MDVENTYGFQGSINRNGNWEARPALIIILDPDTKQVLLWRVHNMPEKMDEIEENLKNNELKNNMENVQWKDTRNQDISLKDAAEQAGLYLLKDDTMSNWSSETLRRDQKRYAGLVCLPVMKIA